MSTTLAIPHLHPLFGPTLFKNLAPTVARKRSTSNVHSVSKPACKPQKKQAEAKKEMLVDGEILWQRVQEGDASAIGELYDNIGSALFSLAFRILNDRWEAEEVVQDVISAFWKKPLSYSPQRGKLHSWLLTFTRNRSIDRYRSRRRRKDNQEMDEVTLETRADPVAEDAGEQAEFSDEQLALKKAMTMIGEKQRQVLELSFFKGMTHAEIAQDTGLSLGTVKSRIRLGLDKLRGQLAGLR